MRPHEIEAWVLRIVDIVTNHQPIEDSRVELKRVFIDPRKAARRIAGHANASQGAQVLWVIGLDEEQGIIGVDDTEFSSWWGQVSSCFDGLAPGFEHINVPVGEGKVLTAVLFETDRAPYVVKTPNGGEVQCEVPWREGTMVRTAKRSDLIKVLSPLVTTPTFEVIECIVYSNSNSYEASLNWFTEISLYVISDLSVTHVFPFHKCSVQILDNSQNTVSLEDIEMGVKTKSRAFALQEIDNTGLRVFNQSNSSHPTIKSTNNELFVSGPGQIQINAGQMKATALTFIPDKVEINLQSIYLQKSIKVEIPVGKSKRHWKMNNWEYTLDQTEGDE